MGNEKLELPLLKKFRQFSREKEKPEHRSCLWSAREIQSNWKLGKNVVERSGSLLVLGKLLFRDVCGGH